MKKRVLIHTINVFFQGQKVSFQINLPRDAKKIVSVHHSIIPKSEGDEYLTKKKPEEFFERTTIMGDLRLQSFEKAGWFYVGDVTTQDRNLTWGDVSIISNLFVPSEATHSRSNFLPLTVMLDASESTIINGYYCDRVGILMEGDIEYMVRIYLEVELENCKP